MQNVNATANAATKQARPLPSSPAQTAEILVPSINFSMICPGIYRSGYPTKKNFRFLRALRLKTICYLCPEDYAQTNQKFCEENNIEVVRFPMEGNKEPFVYVPEQLLHRCLSVLCDTRKHPILIHCNKGKHRTGTVCACLRKLQGWAHVSICDEYLRFAGDKGRSSDQQYVELYRPIVILRPPFTPSWLDLCEDVTVVGDEAELDVAAAAQAGFSLSPTTPTTQKPEKRVASPQTSPALQQQQGPFDGSVVATAPIAVQQQQPQQLLPPVTMGLGRANVVNSSDPDGTGTPRVKPTVSVMSAANSSKRKDAAGTKSIQT